jgi:integrase
MAEIRKLNVKYGKAWEVRYSFSRDGKRMYRRPRFATRDLAKTFAAAVATDAATGYVNDYSRGKETFEAYAERWLRLKAQSSKTKPQTVARYRTLLERHALPAFGSKAVRSITVADVNDFIATLASEDRSAVTATDAKGALRARRKSLSTGTIRHALHPVRHVLALAVREGALRHNVVMDAELPRADRTFSPQFLSPEQVDTLASVIEAQQNAATAPDAPDGTVYALVVLVLAYTGLRVGELAGLTIADIKPQRVEVTRTLTKIKGGYRIGTPKNGKARTVPLPPWLAEDLAAYIATTHGDPRPEAPLFPGRTQHLGLRRGSERAPRPATRLDWSVPWDRDAFYRSVFRPALAEAGLSVTLRLHDLRHSYISICASLGIPAYRVAAYAGHTDPGFTLRVYTHLFNADATDDMERLARPRAATAPNILHLQERRTS